MINMSICEDLINKIEKKLEKIGAIAPFKRAFFGDVDLSATFPAIHYVLKSRDAFDEPHLVHNTMQLRWELIYEVQVMFARLPGRKTESEARQHVDKAVELFIQQMSENARLDGKAWWIEPDGVRYGVIEFEFAGKMEYVLGGVFDLSIKFLQDVEL